MNLKRNPENCSQSGSQEKPLYKLPHKSTFESVAHIGALLAYFATLRFFRIVILFSF